MTTEVDQELERLFSVTRDATQPDAEARARIRAGLAARMAAEPPPIPQGPTSGRRLWFGLGGAVVGLGALVLVLSRGATSQQPPAEVEMVAASVTAVASAASPPVAVPEPPITSQQVAAPAPSIAPALPSKPTPPKPPVSSTASLAESADDELALVRSMQQALRSGNAQQALALAAEHARRFPSGTLSEEREGARAVARCQLAPPAARPAILESFARSFGASPYAARVKAACQ